MERRKIAVSDLLLWEDNPRVAHSLSQSDEIQKIYNSGTNARQKTAREHLMNLLGSVAMEGFQSEVHPVLVLELDGRYVVKDGNRRLAALKLLNDPDKYEDILSSSHMKKIQRLLQEYSQNIPSHIEAVVYSKSEEKKLDETLARIHQGPLDGVGIVQWSTEATDRFFGRRTFSDQFEAPFEQQFGMSLTSYLGGTQAITTRRRIFEYAAVKKYLGAKNSEVKINVALLDKIKNLADAVKEHATQNNKILSRFQAEDVKQALADMVRKADEEESSAQNEERDGESPGAQKSDSGRSDEPCSHDGGDGAAAQGETNLMALSTFQEFGQQYQSSRDGNLGGKYLKEENFNFENRSFGDLNFLLAALNQFGENTGPRDKRLQRIAILSPAIRTFYELSLLALQENKLVGSNVGISTNHESNVENVLSQMKDDDKFKNYLSKNYAIFSGFKEVGSILGATDFKGALSVSQLTAHKAIRNVTEDQARSAFEQAVLFSLLAQAFVTFKTGAIAAK